MNQETIERAARAHYESLKPVNNWEGLTEFIRDLYRDIARAVIAAIHPTVSSVEELDALPDGSVVMDELGIALRKTIVGWWADTGDNRMSSEHLADNSTELTVLHIGGAA